MILFTPQQQKVIDTHNRNVLVSAAAGSGKTAVLVERIIRMICDKEHPIDIDRLLVVTFTNAAAAEMRERISLGINRELALQPENEHIQKQATLLHNAQITTIDSFCLFLIRNHFHEIGLDPAFRVADPGEIKLMQADVLKDLLEEKFAQKDPDFLYCVEYFCPNGRESVLEQHILNLFQYASSYPWPLDWLKERKEDYHLDTIEELEQSNYGIYLRGHLQAMIKGCIAAYRRIKNLCEEPDGPYMYGELIEWELEQLEKLAACNTLQEFALQLPAINFGRLSSKKDSIVTPLKREMAKKQRVKVKDTLQGLLERFFVTPLKLAVKQSKQCEKPVTQLIDLTLEFSQRMKEKKQERKLLDFSDMEHYALEILLDREGDEIKASQVALEYQQYFQEILIDEYQDSNLVQEYLLRAISGEEQGNFNRFMVGDVKQSIYKFRLARPELFLEKYNTYMQEGKECQRIDLSKNFRSRNQVVDTVNAVFSHIMTRQTGGITYDEKAALYTGASYPENLDCESELLFIERPKRESESGKRTKGSLPSKQAEALAIARKILELRGSFQVTEKETGKLRPVRFSDIVILLRTNSGWDEEFKKVLEQQGIPVYITAKTGYFSALEVQELLQMLRVLDNPRQDIPLFGVLKSIFGGFSEEEIALLRSTRQQMSLYEALEECRQQPKVEAFLNQLKVYREYTAYMSIRELLQHIVNDYDYLNYVTALPAGGKRRANVEMLFTKASDFEKTSYFGLFHFIRYIEQLEKYDVDYGEAELLDENADVVRIMSIHKSKGLEFPVTFVAGLSKRFNMQDANQSLIIDVDMGIGTDYVDPEKRIRNRTLRRQVLARKMREDNLAEEMRVLYVAMTRPKEKLILTACLENAKDKWEEREALGNILRGQKKAGSCLEYHEYMEAGSYMDFLLPILEEAKVKVTILDMQEMQALEGSEQTRLLERKERLKHAEEYMDSQALQTLKQRFSYQYPYQMLQNLYTKTTVSELKMEAMTDKNEGSYHAFEEHSTEPYLPKFRMQEGSVGGIVRGNAFHKVMEQMDFAAVYQGISQETMQQITAFQIKKQWEEFLTAEEKEKIRENLEQWLTGQVTKGYLSEEYRQAISLRKLVNFLCQPIAFRMWQAEQKGQLYREQPFVYGISASRMNPQFPEDEKVLIQGIVDIFFVEEGKLVLVDYKTDAVKEETELWNRYQTQMQYYEEAICNLMEMEMKEKMLYSFSMDKCVMPQGEKEKII